MRIRVFFSHSSKDYELVAALADYLGAIGLEVFVAHKQIEVSRQWEQRITEEINRAEVFVALLTKNFHASDWTDQEFGMALALEKTIVPLADPILPYGFMAKTQAHRLDGDLRQAAVEIGKAIASESKLTRRLRSALARHLKDCANYDQAIAATRLINELKGFSRNLVNCIIHAAATNHEIYGCVALKNVQVFYEKHRDVLSPENRSRFKRRL